jgi:hypothetical protein
LFVITSDNLPTPLVLAARIGLVLNDGSGFRFVSCSVCGGKNFFFFQRIMEIKEYSPHK